MTRIKGQNDQEFFSFLVVLPFFLISQGVPFKDTGSLNGTLSEFLKKMIRSCKICIATAESILKQGKLKVYHVFLH